MKFKVELQDVGRDKHTDEFFVEAKGTKEEMARQVNSRIYNELTNHLISSNISFDGELGQWGNVFAGFHAVGKFRISEVEE